MPVKFRITGQCQQVRLVNFFLDYLLHQVCPISIERVNACHAGTWEFLGYLFVCWSSYLYI